MSVGSTLRRRIVHNPNSDVTFKQVKSGRPARTKPKLKGFGQMDVVRKSGKKTKPVKEIRVLKPMRPRRQYYSLNNPMNPVAKMFSSGKLSKYHTTEGKSGMRMFWNSKSQGTYTRKKSA